MNTIKTPAELARSYLSKRHGDALGEEVLGVEEVVITEETNRVSEADALAPEQEQEKTVEVTAKQVPPEQILAWVNGLAMETLPQDLYIPPDALEVVLDAFEGPLDFLLYLIRRQNLDILQIPLAEVTRQYMDYMELMKTLRLELAAEYLVMAALLGEIKSRSLLPRPKHDEGEETDPRVQLLRRLQEYERCKQAASALDELPQSGRDFFIVGLDRPEYEVPLVHPDIDLREVLLALKDVLARADLFESHNVHREKLSTRERMSIVLERLRGGEFVPFILLFTPEEGRLGVVVTFLAILQLMKESMIDLVQGEPFAPIHVRLRVTSYEEIPEAFAEVLSEPTDIFERDNEAL